jgi:preprotein translocase subunit YajC
MNETLMTLIPLILIIAVFYFFMIRPENKKKKKAAEMRANLKVGDVITTIGGVIGTVCAVKDETIVIETGADRVRIEFTKWAISTVGAQTTENASAK